MMRSEGSYHVGFETVRALQQQMRDERVRDRVAEQARAGTAFPGWFVLIPRRSMCALLLLMSKVVSRGRLSGRRYAVPGDAQSGRAAAAPREVDYSEAALKAAGSVPVDHRDPAVAAL